MRANVGRRDALVRGVTAIVLVVFGVSTHARGLLSFAAVLGGLLLMATALTRECPVYRLFHTGTGRPTPAPRPRHG